MWGAGVEVFEGARDPADCAVPGDENAGAARARDTRRYTHEDVALLAELDRLHETLSGATTRSRRRGAMVACGISPRHAKRAGHFTARHVTYCA